MDFNGDMCLLKMKTAIMTLALASVLLCAYAENGDAFPRQDLFGASFEDYAPGDQLCDTGAVNGTWGVVPTNVAVAERDDDRGVMYMKCATLDDGIVFTPTVTSDKKMIFSSATVRATGYEYMAQLPTPIGARAAFAVLATEDGETNYVGWVCSQNRWTKLFPVSSAVAPASGEWHEVLAKFLKADGGREYVQYCLKRERDAGYVPLQTEDRVFWLDANVPAQGGMRGKVGITGEGDLERISGSELRRGLVVGVGSWYDYVFGESIYNTNPNAWTNAGEPARTRSDELRSYIINVEGGGQSVTYSPVRTHPNKVVEVTELEVVFAGVNDDESIPTDACARIRVVETSDEEYRFACLAAGQWKTNDVWRIDVDAQYTVEISLDNGSRTVSYRFKDGYGLEGGAYKDLFLDEPMQQNASGKTLNIDFDGSGIVHAIRGKDRQK